MTYADALAALDALYAELPHFVCQGHCQASCGVIIMTKPEWLRITRKLGYRPKGKPSLVCPMLKNGRCSVHAIRPLVCRLFGLMDESLMHCPWGCKPERWLTEEEGYVLLERAEAIAREAFPASEATAYAHGIARDELPAYMAQAKREGKVRYERVG